jgi:hypothetical protein
MRRHRVNRNFTKPEAIGPIVFPPNSFEQVVTALRISPEEYLGSPKLRDWVRRNKDQRYVPMELLEAFGFQVNSEFFREPWLRIQTRSRAMSGGFLLWLDLCPPRPLSRSNLATSRRGHSSLGLRNWNDLLLSLDFCPSSSLSRCDASAPFCRQFATRFGASPASIYSSEGRKCRIQSG